MESELSLFNAGNQVAAPAIYDKRAKTADFDELVFANPLEKYSPSP